MAISVGRFGADGTYVPSYSLVHFTAEGQPARVAHTGWLAQEFADRSVVELRELFKKSVPAWRPSPPGPPPPSDSASL